MSKSSASTSRVPATSNRLPRATSITWSSASTTPITSSKPGLGARMTRTSPCSSTSPARKTEAMLVSVLAFAGSQRDLGRRRPEKRARLYSPMLLFCGHDTSCRSCPTAQFGICYSAKYMASHVKLACLGLCALYLSLVLFLGGVAVQAQEAAVAPPSAVSKPVTDADFIAAADEVLLQMSQITGLKLVTPLKKSLRSREEIRAYVIKQMNEDKNAAERYADERSAEAFGLLPKGFDLDSFMVNVLTEQVEGLYDPKTREFYIADWSPLADQRMVMAHELTHALEDQHFQIEAWARAARPNEDAELARDSVLEGSAMAAMIDYLMLGTGRSLKDALMFPYLGGLTFSAAVMKNTGWSALPGLFEKPPVSTQQILHPALYQSGKTPRKVTLPPLEKVLGDNWSKLDENIMGEFGWKEVLKQFLDNDRAKSLAAAWDGDRYMVFEQKRTKKLLLVTRLCLDSEELAARFFGQYSEALEKKYSERTNLLRRPNFFSFDTPDGGVFLDCLGEECVTLEGATRNMFDGFTKALNWPLAPPPRERPGAAPAKTAAISAPAAPLVAGIFSPAAQTVP